MGGVGGDKKGAERRGGEGEEKEQNSRRIIPECGN